LIRQDLDRDLEFYKREAVEWRRQYQELQKKVNSKDANEKQIKEIVQVKRVEFCLFDSLKTSLN
jgi:hypothetical protein